MKRLVAIGEAMIELSGQSDDGWHMGVAGDTLNTAWYARQHLGNDWRIDYVTRIGADPFSKRIVDFIQTAGLGIGHIQHDETRSAGLYAISLLHGERSFTYWRGQSAARHLADTPTQLDQAVAGASAVFFSGITLAILAPDRRKALLDTIARSDARIVFDPNYRAKLWESKAAACDWTLRAAAISHILLPSMEDEAACFDDATPKAILERYEKVGASEIIIKNGGDAVTFAHDGRQGRITALPRVTPIDTTGAGDSFNAGYLAGRLCGSSVPDAIHAAHKVALKVVQMPGALVYEKD